MSETEEKPIVLETPEQAHGFVLEAHNEVLGLIHKKLQKIHPQQRYVLFARVVNLVFARTFHPVMIKAEGTIPPIPTKEECEAQT